MTPSNPSNSQPLIYRIMDALGVSHLVACINHTHDQSEVEGLTAALNSKAPINHSHDFIGEDTGVSYAGVTASEGTVHIEVRNQSGGGECDITPSNIGNLINALDTPDATPTANSDKLVTSGGVKTALNGKADSVHTHIPSQIYGLIPTYIDYSGTELDLDTLVDDNWGMNKVIVKNDTNSDTTFASLFVSEESLPVHLNGNGAATIAAGYYALCTIYKIDKDMNQDDDHPHDLCYFVTLDGIFDSGD